MSSSDHINIPYKMYLFIVMYMIKLYISIEFSIFIQGVPKKVGFVFWAHVEGLNGLKSKSGR